MKNFDDFYKTLANDDNTINHIAEVVKNLTPEQARDVYLIVSNILERYHAWLQD